MGGLAVERDRALATRSKQTKAKPSSAAIGISIARTVADQSVRAVLSRIFAFIFEADIRLEIEQAGIVLAVYGIPRCPESQFVCGHGRMFRKSTKK
jgi:hypothetical protein